MRLLPRFRAPSLSFGQLDPSVARGLGVCALFIFGGMVFSGQGASFISLAGLAIVIGGTFGATSIQHSSGDLALAKEGFFEALYRRSVPSVGERVAYFTKLSKVVKRDGLMPLDGEAHRAKDSFLRLGLELCVDRYSPEEIRQILENEMKSSYEKNLRKVNVFESLGGYAPAMGLIGTLIGLVQMLHSLGDAAQVGPAMSVALLTTLYGALLANIVFFPIAGKLRSQLEQAVHVKSVTLEGILSLAQEENSVVLGQRLQSFQSLQEVG
ncbi:MAG: MotA/TolQ/ExbB proton channel family protein [Bdellovibrionales bacterium]|nr:MotA/TolQ/ExbB proton channel family protein [Bdellovibrionales bacterium]